MKKLIKVSGLLLIFFLSVIIFPVKANAQQPYISYQVFYDQLSPYGQWVNFQNYGYVWLPDAGWDFAPYYTGGYWIMTQYGWTWFSEYDWGWAPFHYGRWDFDNDYGWFWVPGNEWGPAWVTWRRASGYYGWAPMRPGVNISMNFGNNYDYYNNHWMFVNDRYFGRNDMYRYYANYNDYDMIFRNSVIITNIYVDNSRQSSYFSGPDPTEVRRTTGRRVNSFDVQEINVPGHGVNNREYQTYKPQVINKSDSRQDPAPVRVTRQQDLKRPSERNSEVLYRSNSGLQVQKQNEEFRQEEIIRKNSLYEQNAINRQDAAIRQNDVINQNEGSTQNAIERQNTIERQNAIDRQNAVNRQNATINQNAVSRQAEIDQQKAAIRTNEVNVQNAANRQRAVDQQNADYQRNELNRQKEQQNAAREERTVKTQNNQQINTEQPPRREVIVKPVRQPKEQESGKKIK